MSGEVRPFWIDVPEAELAGKRDEASVALEQALALYERKGNLVMVQRAQGRREALRALA
jgi:hypothetical protein